MKTKTGTFIREKAPSRKAALSTSTVPVGISQVVATVEGSEEESTEEFEGQGLDAGSRSYSDTVELIQSSTSLRRRGNSSLSMEKSSPEIGGWTRNQVLLNEAGMLNEMCLYILVLLQDIYAI